MRGAPTPSDLEEIQIGLHQGRRLALWPLFEIADDSPVAIRRYLDLGLVHVALIAGVPIGHAQIITHDVRVWELKSLAVLAAYRGRGVGSQLVRRSMARVREHGAERFLVATAAAHLDNLGFYQRLGFRMLRIERDAFTPEGGYPEGLTVRGVPVRDRVWLELGV
jgi:GNAT superfamily N-acetyltransferase